MKSCLFKFPSSFAAAALVFALGVTGNSCTAYAAMSFCNRTSGAIEAALGYRGDDMEKSENWVSEGWWRIEPGQCARVFSQPLSQRFYFYYGRALTKAMKDSPPMVWSGKYIFCTDNKAFRVEGDSDCAARKYQSTGFQQIDLGGIVHEYTLEFKDTTAR